VTIAAQARMSAVALEKITQTYNTIGRYLNRIV
jgi:hypothetical protein